MIAGGLQGFGRDTFVERSGRLSTNGKVAACRIDPKMTRSPSRLFRILVRRWRSVLWACILLAVVPALCDLGLGWAARGRIHAVAADVPEAPVALVLGAAKLHHGSPNRFYGPRIAAAAELFKAGRVRGILVSGDNGRVGYSEPEDMRDDLVAAGVPARYITLDHAGFRTLDSLVRAKEVFGQTRLVVVSQKFHLERALFVADHQGIEASGYVAEDPTSRRYLKTRAREVLARAGAVLDVLIERRPRFGGPREAVALRE